jgi:hypothetical protein
VVLPLAEIENKKSLLIENKFAEYFLALWKEI